LKILPCPGSLHADILFGWRRLRKNKVTSAAAILSLALAIGSCISAFQLVDALLLRPLPVAAPDRLYALSRQNFQMYGKPTTYDGWEFPLFQGMRDAVAKQAALIAISFAERVDLTFHSDQEMEKVHVQYVSGNLFGAFGLRPAAGRLLTENDDLHPGAHFVAVLSHDYWSRRFAEDPRVIGRTFRMANTLTGLRIYQIVGVVAKDFTGTEPGKMIDIFMPSMMHWGITYPDWSLFRTFVQLQPGLSPEPVRDRLAEAVRLRNQEKAQQRPKERANILNQLLLMQSAAAGVSGMQKDYRISLAALSVLVALVLLIACANVANLMTAQAAARSREMALRVSIGAGRLRLVQLVLVESALLGLSAAAIAWWFARWSAPFVIGKINPPDDPARLALPVDWRVLAFGLALALGVTLLFGLAPALRASAVQPVTALKGGDDSRWRGHSMRALIAAQAAFCFLVLLVAGLFVATFDRLSQQPTGFSAQHLLTLNAVTRQNEPSPVWDQVADHLRRLPGVETVAYSDWPLLDGYSFKRNGVSINGAPPTEDGAWFMNVSPGWLGAMRIPLLGGRDFRASDLSPGAAIVNESFARQYFEHQNPLGKWFEGTSGYMLGQRFQIVGLVRDARYRYLREGFLPVAYTPFNRTGNAGKAMGGTFVVRISASNPLAFGSMLRQEIARARSGFRVSSMRTQEEVIESQTIRERLLATLARFFGAVALLLAGVGLYGVLDFSVFQRRREIGIRMALGAQAGDVARRVTISVFSMVLLGAIAGLMLGMASVRYIEALLYQVKANELGVLAVPSLALLGAAVLAAVPAVIRAVKIDPATLLRSE
jgi:putative ABC transport system permease protein